MHPVPTGTDIDANQSSVQRWQEAQPLHETGVVSRVPRSAQWAQVLETDSNTYQSAIHTKGSKTKGSEQENDG